MSYVVLARKWRPQQLVDVLGQEHVTRTLRNAFASGRIAQTFLFTGPRGVGKTSAARILAKALCCESSDGPTPEPCGVCRQCRAIAEGTSTDVIEIDAASHTGVDNVRDVIIDAVRYLPSSARFKVYIIDEVHMLSSSSFNALLKTFEEPPPHVKFVLATTDPHKVPVTILSRCQRYDFRLIASARMQSRLSEILLAEEVDHDPSALALVARIADGSMRDAQSLLEQVLAFAGERRIDGDIVREALGAVDAALVERTIASIFESAPDAVFRSVAEVHERGLGHARFAGSLVEHVRDLVAARMVKDPSAVVDRPADEIASLVQFASQHAPERLERLFEALCRLQEEVARSLQPRYALEVGLASLAAQPAAVPVDALMGQLERVERALSGGGSGGPAPRRFSRPGGGGRPSAGRSPEHVSSAQHGGPRTHGRAPSRPRRGVGGDEPPAEPEPSAPTISAPPEPPLERPPPGNPADPPPLPSVGPNEPPLPE
ncbi:MAG: DNA polymerase III subunit gamma/tau, partial [Myxococcota bacterium]